MKNITTALSIASLSLLQHGCGGGSSGGSDNSTLTPNTSAPDLIAKWATDCIGQSSGTSTSTGTSGGGGSGSIRGDYALTSFTFNQNGSGNVSKDDFSENNCNPTFRVNSSSTSISYIIGNSTLDSNGMSATEINITYNSNVSYTMFKISGNDLYIADIENSSATNNGSTAGNRLNGFPSDEYNKQ